MISKQDINEAAKLIVDNKAKHKEQDEDTRRNELRESIALRYKKYIKGKNRKKVGCLGVYSDQKFDLYKTALSGILRFLEPNGREWDFSKNGDKTSLLLCWFARWQGKFEEIAKKIESTEGGRFSYNKDFYVVGEKGSGKSTTIKALNELVSNFHIDGGNKIMQFVFAEQNKIATTYELESNINKWTYNEQKGKFEGNPVNVILDDMKFGGATKEFGLTKSFGTDFIEVLVRFLYDRYSIYLFGGAHTIITGLLTPAEIKKHMPGDLYNRFQHQYNILVFKGANRKS